MKFTKKWINFKRNRLKSSLPVNNIEPARFAWFGISLKYLIQKYFNS